MVSIDDLYEVIHGLFKEPIIGSLKSKMTEIRHLENRHHVVFFCGGWSDLDKISETGAEWHADCGDVVEIETRCRIPIWRTFERIQWHVIPEPRITLQDVATWNHIAILKFYIWFWFWPHHPSRHVILHQSPKFYPNWTTVGRKKWRYVDSRRRISAILDFRDLIMGSLKSPIHNFLHV